MINDIQKLTDKFSVGIGKGITEQLSLKGNVVLKLFDKSGNLKTQKEIHNTVTNAGKYGCIDQILAAPTLAKVGWCAVGTGTPGGTLLGGEIARVVFMEIN